MITYSSLFRLKLELSPTVMHIYPNTTSSQEIRQNHRDIIQMTSKLWKELKTQPFSRYIYKMYKNLVKGA